MLRPQTGLEISFTNRPRQAQMAKKQKPKKAGLAKRQTKKNQQRQHKVRSIKAERTPQRAGMKPGKVKKILRNLPMLALEPEVSALGFSQAQIDAVTPQHEKLPDAVDALSTLEFLTQLEAALNQVMARYQAQGNKEKLVLAQAMLYFLAQKAPACMNQVVVALWIKTQLETQGEEVTLAALQAGINAYDEDWKDYLEEIAQARMPQGETDAADEDEEEEDEEDDNSQSPFAPLLEQFGEWLEENASEHEDADRILEDAEVLLYDYAAEKGFHSLSDLTPQAVELYLKGWFPRNLHPTPQDQTQMAHMVVKLFLFFAAKGHKSPVDAAEVSRLAC